ncbi:MAG: hypothetical protein ACRDJX_09685 [Solirubrobacteraceae bacterium]
MIRRLALVGALIVVIIIAALIISAIIKSGKQQELKSYNREVSQLGRESVEQVASPMFTALTKATSKPALDVEQQVDELLTKAQAIVTRTKALSVPGEMVSTQQDLLLTMDLRAEGMTKLAAQLPTALGGKAKQKSAEIAGDMEIFLASDVIYSQRVVPLMQERLVANGITGLVSAQSRFLPNVGWLESSSVLSRISGQAVSSSSTGLAPGTHGSQLLGVGVGANELQPEPTLNHISAGANPTFTVVVEDSGENPETNVKVDVTVTAAGRKYKASHVIASTEPGQRYNAEVAVAGVPQGAAATVEAYVEPVAGETDVENNKATYLAIFGE